MLIKKNPSICIVSHNAYGTISGKDGHIGGVEWQTALTARWLAECDYPVCLITWDEGGETEEIINGVRIIKVCKQNDGIPGLRFFHPKWTGLNAALKRANASIYYHNLADCETGQVALWCKINKKKFVFSVPSNPDCDIKLPKLKTIRERVLYRYGLKNADLIIVQNLTQKNKLMENFRLNSILIPMPCPDNSLYNSEKRFSAPSNHILWVGRIAKEKRPDKLIDIAVSCPDLVFDVVGPVDQDNQYSKNIYLNMQKIPNIILHGGVSREKVYLFYEKAACLCCTSDFEGFPNTFLEAWSCGLPIVSTFDPDGLIARLQLGIVSSDTMGIINGIKSLIDNNDKYYRRSKNARDYYQKNHSANIILPKFERIFKNLSR